MAAIIVGLMALRTNTAISLLALCAGSVLLSSSGDNMSLVASSLTSGLDSSTNVIRIVLLFVPLLVCAIALRKQLKKTQLPLAFIPAIAIAMLSVIFVAPELSESVQASISETDVWKLLIQYQEFIIAFGLVASILLIVMTVKKPEIPHKKGKH